MSGSHQFYTVTGRALPLPPKRTPSRHSAILRLPTRRAEEERSMAVRADSPGRIEAPRGGEFHNIPDSLRAASQIVVYDGAAAAAAAARAEARKAARHAARAAASSKASSVAGNSRRGAATAATVAAAAAPATLSTTHASPTPSESAASSHDYTLNRARVAVPKMMTSGRTSLQMQSTVFSEGSDSVSETSSPCLNRLSPPGRSHHHGDNTAWQRGVVADYAASDVQSIPMSSARQSQTPADRQRPRPTHTDDVDQRSIHSRSAIAHHDAAPLPSTRRDGGPAAQGREPPQRRHTAAVADDRTPADRRSHWRASLSASYTTSDVSATHPSSAAAAAAARATPPASVVPVPVSPVVAAAYSASATTADSRGRPAARHPPLSTEASGIVSSHHHDRSAVDRHDHSYSDRKIAERRASRPAADTSTDVSYRPLASSQQMALVPAPAMVRYSTRSPLSDDDPLEMNSPIADRVRQRSIAITGRSGVSGGVGTVEGTELMPSRPRLQGRRATASGQEEEDRTFRTIVRFIEYQPEAERPALEAMLRDFSGHEEELCALLTDTYGEDFDMLKAACGRGPSAPLLSNHTARALLLTDAKVETAAAAVAVVAAPPRNVPAPSQRTASSVAAAVVLVEDVVDSEGHYREAMQFSTAPVVDGEEGDGYEEYLESSRPYSTPRVEEGDYDEEPVYDADNYAREMLTPAVPYERR